MDGKTVAFYLNDREIKQLNELKNVMKFKSNSEFMRYLINEKYHDYTMFNLSDKQIFTKYHSNRKKVTNLMERG